MIRSSGLEGRIGRFVVYQSSKTYLVISIFGEISPGPNNPDLIHQPGGEVSQNRWNSGNNLEY